MFNWLRRRWKPDPYIRAEIEGRVVSVCAGLVVIDDREYPDLCKTFVQPGQKIRKGAVVGVRRNGLDKVRKS